jgi:hypothetical protein
MSSSIEIAAPSILMFHSTPTLVSPGDVPHPQGPPSPRTTAVTMASAFQFVAGRFEGTTGADAADSGAGGGVGVVGVA